MWFLVLIAGLTVTAGAGWLARRVFLSGQKTLGRLVEFVRWPLWGAWIWVTFGVARHQAAWPLAWLGIRLVAVGVAGRTAYLLVKATYRTVRILRQRQAVGSLPAD
jgi:hypothetical protein